MAHESTWSRDSAGGDGGRSGYAGPRRCRQAARDGLIELKDRTILPDLIAALRSGRVAVRSVAHVLARLDLPGDDIVAWLSSAEIFERTLGVRIVESLREEQAVMLDPSIAQAARTALERPLDVPSIVLKYLRRRLA